MLKSLRNVGCGPGSRLLMVVLLGGVGWNGHAVAEIISLEVSPYVVILPESHTVQLSLEPAEQSPDCTALFTQLRRNNRNIERCAAPENERPDSYCNLFKEDLSRDLLGIINSRFGTREPDVLQKWNWQVSTHAATNQQREDFAVTNGYPLDAVDIGKVAIKDVNSLSLVVADSSYTAKLKNAEILEWQPQFQLHGEQVVTEDRLTYCELQSGALQVRGVATLRVTFAVPSERQQLPEYYRLYQELRDLEDHSTFSPAQRWLLGGWMFAEFLSDTVNQEVNQESLLRLAELFYSEQSDQAELISTANFYQLGRRMSQTNLTRTIDVELVPGG